MLRKQKNINMFLHILMLELEVETIAVSNISVHMRIIITYK